jgi:hypothetical protein
MGLAVDERFLVGAARRLLAHEVTVMRDHQRDSLP